jgi:UDP-glucose 4-epimerase
MPDVTDPSRSGQVPARRVLVTGGAGFIGSHLTDLLLARGDQVTVVDDLSTGRRENLPTTHAGLRFVEADLSEFLHATGTGERFDLIFHLAAAVGVRLVMDDPIGSIRTNVEQTAALLEFAATHGPGGAPAPTLIASSSEVYGKAAKSPFSEEDDVVYGPTTKGRWSYACSKALDEFLALAFARQRGLPVVVARFFNTVGPRQVGEYGMVLPRFVAAALKGETLQVLGDGQQSRCFCDVRDVAPACVRLVETPACHGRVFNVGSDRPITIAELAERVLRVLHPQGGGRAERIPYDRVYADGFEDLRQRQPDLSRVRAAIGFEPRIGLEQTIRDLAEELRARGVAGPVVTTPAQAKVQAR